MEHAKHQKSLFFKQKTEKITRKTKQTNKQQTDNTVVNRRNNQKVDVH